MRVLIMGFWSRSTHWGGVHSGMPSVLMWQVQARARKLWWWYAQTKVRLFRLVSPPSIHSVFDCSLRSLDCALRPPTSSALEDEERVFSLLLSTAARNPDVMPFAGLRWVGAAGERAAAVAGDQRQGLRPAGDPPAPAQFEDGSGGGEDGGDDVGVVGQLQQFPGRQHRAVRGPAVPDPIDQIVGVDGDDHGGRDAAGIRSVSGAQLPVAEIFEGVVAALPVGPPVHRTGWVDP